MINTLLFVAGINTLLQTWFGTRLPVVMGGSYAFIIPSISIALSNNSNSNRILIEPHQVGLPILLMPFSNFYGCVCFLVNMEENT